MGKVLSAMLEAKSHPAAAHGWIGNISGGIAELNTIAKLRQHEFTGRTYRGSFPNRFFHK